MHLTSEPQFCHYTSLLFCLSGPLDLPLQTFPCSPDRFSSGLTGSSGLTFIQSLIHSTSQLSHLLVGLGSAWGVREPQIHQRLFSILAPLPALLLGLCQQKPSPRQLPCP